MPEKRNTIGTDPEFFLVDKKTGKLVSAIPHIEGTKYNPEPLPSGGSIQRDNVALEFATPPAESGEDLVAKVRNAFMDVFKKVGDAYDIAAIPSADFDPDQLDHEEAKAFGCEPDYDAWEFKINEPPPLAETSTFRSCGAHIHVGHVKGDGNDFLLEIEGKILTVKMMDLVHGIISTVLDNSEAAIKRRKLYGKAGCHRPTSYGVEYRVLSNFWMKSPQLVMLMDSLTQDVLRFIRDKQAEGMIEEIGEKTIKNTINKGSVSKARKIVDNYLRPKLSKDSIHYLDECLKFIELYDLKKEWMEVSK
jgi:hypothetical protein